MSYEDWVKSYDKCQICNLTPDIEFEIEEHVGDNSPSSNLYSLWQCTMFHGEWKRGVSAGGRGEPNQGFNYLLYNFFLSSSV